MSIDLQCLTPAERLLWGYGIVQPDQIDLEAIAADHGATVRYRTLGGCEARLVAREDAAVISVNLSNSVGRQRFSLAHEIAHWLCDRNTGSFLCAKEDIGPQNAEAKSVEAHANGYASQLILPTYLVDPWLIGRKTSLELASALSDEFRTSLTAAAIKLIKRTDRIACLTCHDTARLLWHQRSRSFPSDYFVLRELHHDTEAFRLAFGGTGMSRSRKEPASRWVSGQGVFRVEATTQSVKLPGGAILTLVALGS